MGKKVRTQKRKQPFRFIKMESVVLLLHQQAPKWGQLADGLYETEVEFRAEPNGLSGELASFVAAGGTLEQLARAATDIFIQRAKGFGEVGQETRQALISQLDQALREMLQEYRGGKV